MTSALPKVRQRLSRRLRLVDDLAKLRDPGPVQPAPQYFKCVGCSLPLLMAVDRSGYSPSAFIIACKAGDEAEKIEIVHSVAKAIDDRNLKLLTIVTWLGPHVTQIDDLIQNAQAVEYFAAIIELFDPSLTPRQDVDLVAKWFIGRLEHWDAPGLRDSFSALRALSEKAPKSRFTDECAESAITQLLKNASIFSEQPPKTRRQAFGFLLALLVKRSYIANDLGDRLIDGVLALGDKEKDPEALMLWFEIMKLVLQSPSFDASKHLQPKAWESISKYYPITYRGEGKVIVEDLKSSLRKCIAATNIFSQYAMEFLPDKLDEHVSANVKKDVIRTIDACVLSYDQTAVEAWSSELLKKLKYEVLNVVEEELATDALKVLKDVAIRLSAETTINNVDGSTLMRYVHEIVKDFNSELMDTRGKVVQSGKMLTAVAESSGFAFEMIIKQTLPRLITIYSDTKSMEEKEAIIRIIVDLIGAPYAGRGDIGPLRPTDVEKNRYREVGIDFFDRYVNLLKPFQDNLMEQLTFVALNEEAGETRLKPIAIQGLLLLARPRGFLNEAEIGMIVSTFCDIIVDSMRPLTIARKSTENADIQLEKKQASFSHIAKKGALEALKEMAKFHLPEINVVAVPQLFEIIQKSRSDINRTTNAKDAIEAMAVIAANGDQYQGFNLLMLHEFTGFLDDKEYADLVLRGLRLGVLLRQESSSENTRPDDMKEFQRMIEDMEACMLLKSDGIVKLKPLQQSPSYGSSLVYPDAQVLDKAGRVVLQVLAWMTFEEQAKYVKDTLAYLRPFDGQKGLEYTLEDQPGSIEILLFGKYRLVGLHQEHQISWDPAAICVSLMETFIAKDHPKAVWDAILDAVNALVNKWERTLDKRTPGLSNASPDIRITPMAWLRSHLEVLKSKSPNHYARLIILAMNVTKAANMRGNAKCANELIMTLVKLAPKSWIVATNFEILVGPDEFLTEKYHAKIRKISSSRPIEICLPELLENYYAAIRAQTTVDMEAKNNCMVTLMGLLRWTPASTLMERIPHIFTVILSTLTSTEIGMTAKIGARNQSTAIDILTATIAELPDLITEHIVSVAKVLCDRATDVKGTKIDGRRKALHAISMLAITPELRGPCMTIKSDIMKALTLAVADPNRNVRAVAVKARFDWFNKLNDNLLDE